MTHSYGAICKQCGKRFDASVGGGMRYHLLHCDGCGKEKSIPFEDLGETHIRYIAGLDVPYSTATTEHDREIQRSYQGEPLDRDAYHRAVEEHAGRCRCGGRFTLHAPPRCPSCGSDEFEPDPVGGVILAD